MTTAASGSVSEIEMLRHMASLTSQVIRVNVDGVTHEESLIQPSPAGNCLNWIVGHLTCMNENMVALVGQETVLPQGALARYDRGSPPVLSAAGAFDLSELMRVWQESSRRIDAGLAAMNTETLQGAAPFSPSDDPNETIGSLLTTITFHQAYHAGQTGVLRRITGKAGAIR